MYKTDINQLKYLKQNDELDLNTIINSGYPTFRSAIKRNKLSKPLEILIQRQLLPIWGMPKQWRLAKILDYGCGYGTDASRIGCDRYDPYWYPILPRPPYLYILCTYVLNIIKDTDVRAEVIDHIMSLLPESDGAAYFAVRRDIKEARAVTNRSYWQVPIIMSYPAESIYRCSGFEIYCILKEEWNGKEDSKCSSSL